MPDPSSFTSSSFLDMNSIHFKVLIIFTRTFVVILIVFCLICVVAASETAEDWNDKGRALYKQGKYEEAIKCFDKAIEIDPNFISAWELKGGVLDMLGRHEEAQKCFDKAESIRNPKKGLIDTLIDWIMDMLRYAISMLKRLIPFI